MLLTPFRMLACVLALGLLWAGGFGWFLLQIPRAPTQDTEITDAIVALTGGPGRIDYGLRLLAEGRAKRLFVSGVEGNLTPARLARQAQLAVPSPESVIHLGFDARNTIGNAMEAARWMRREQLSSLRLVTASYHMPRALSEFRYALPEAKIVPDPVVTDAPPALLLSEYHKLLLGWMRHALIDAAEGA